ncbi:MAG TPA: DUF2141 domain-containing protein [Flavobacteriaceae bacterium]|nr:DUF2141 domain-containing protein [Flavobacteriaceae bacterium]
MKNLIVLFACILSFQFLSAQEAAVYYSISAKVPNVQQEGGKVIFSLYDKDTFMKKPITSLVVNIENKTASATFTEVPAGTYAILVLHDKNENNQMDFADNGMPKESYGVSNNKMNFGPPTFNDAKFEVSDKDLELEIKF